MLSQRAGEDILGPGVRQQLTCEPKSRSSKLWMLKELFVRGSVLNSADLRKRRAESVCPLESRTGTCWTHTQIYHSSSLEEWWEVHLFSCPPRPPSSTSRFTSSHLSRGDGRMTVDRCNAGPHVYQRVLKTAEKGNGGETGSSILIRVKARIKVGIRCFLVTTD